LIVAKCDCAKDESKDNTHKANIKQFNYIQSDCAEDVPNLRIVTEDIHNMKEIDWRVEKCTNEGNSDIKCNSPEFHAIVKGLGCLSSLKGIHKEKYNFIQL